MKHSRQPSNYNTKHKYSPKQIEFLIEIAEKVGLKVFFKNLTRGLLKTNAKVLSLNTKI